jgi:phosphoenolpyruvate synthase/pyruvate phosphate dikinase
MIVDLHTQPSVTYEDTGGKGFNLQRLVSIGMPVPRAIVVPHTVDLSLSENHKQILEHDFFRDNNMLYAVRSSAIGEDSENNSYAGAFDTFLDVPRENVITSIERVRASASSSRSTEYNKLRGGATISDMNVIIQHMIPADYAGVAFTMSPIEKDHRIMLIEVIPGNGEALVSGRVTPTTIRYNKLTRMIRREQEGKYAVDQQTIESILEQLIPLLIEIERQYTYPVDVEWAFYESKVHILQARPITT